MSFSRTQLLLIIFLSGLSGFAAFSTDIYLSSMPLIQKLFNTTTAHVQLTLSLFFIVYSFMQLVWGPLSDRWGRKPVLIIGLVLYLLGSLACASSLNIFMLIISRMFQAVGACAGLVIALSMVKDIFKTPKEMSRALTTVTAVVSVSPMLAPVIGSFLLHHFDWESNFYFLAIYSAIMLVATFFVRESYPKEARHPIRNLLTAYKEQIKHLPYLLGVIALSTNFATMFAFISASPFIYINLYHLAPQYFGYFFAINAFSLICGLVMMNQLQRFLSDKTLVYSGAGLSILGSVLIVILVNADPSNIWLVVASSFLVTLGVGFLTPLLTALTLHNVIKHAGLGSSLMGASRYIAGALTGLLMGFLVGSSAIPLGIVMLVLSLFTLGFSVWFFRI